MSKIKLNFVTETCVNIKQNRSSFYYRLQNKKLPIQPSYIYIIDIAEYLYAMISYV